MRDARDDDDDDDDGRSRRRSPRDARRHDDDEDGSRARVSERKMTMKAAGSAHRNQPTARRMLDASEGAMMREREGLRAVRACAEALRRWEPKVETSSFIEAGEGGEMSAEMLAEGEKFANATDAVGRRPRAAAVLGAMLKNLDGLSDALVPCAFFKEFAAGMETKHYESKLYVLRVLLERVPPSRMDVLKSLLGLLHEVLFESIISRRKTAVSVEEDEPPLELAGMFARRLFRARREESEHNDVSVQLVSIFVREYRYLILREKHIEFRPKITQLTFERLPLDDKSDEETTSFCKSRRLHATEQTFTRSISHFNPTDILRSIAASKTERSPRARVLMNESNFPPWLQEHSTDFWQPSVFPPVFHWDTTERDDVETESVRRKKLRKRVKNRRRKDEITSLHEESSGTSGASSDEYEDAVLDEALLQASEAQVDDSDQEEVPIVIKRSSTTKSKKKKSNQVEYRRETLPGNVPGVLASAVQSATAQLNDAIPVIHAAFKSGGKQTGVQGRVHLRSRTSSTSDLQTVDEKSSGATDIPLATGEELIGPVSDDEVDEHDESKEVDRGVAYNDELDSSAQGTSGGEVPPIISVGEEVNNTSGVRDGPLPVTVSLPCLLYTSPSPRD